MNIKRKHPNKKGKLIGRGGTRGKTSGRGHKGQKAHGGHGMRQQMRDIIKKLPKQRGRGKNSNKSIVQKPTAFNLAVIDQRFSDGEIVSVATLVGKGMLGQTRARWGCKILATGSLTKKMRFEGCELSAAARQKIEQAGGTIA